MYSAGPDIRGRCRAPAPDQPHFWVRLPVGDLATGRDPIPFQLAGAFGGWASGAESLCFRFHERGARLRDGASVLRMGYMVAFPICG